MNKPYVELTPEERQERKALTAQEQAAIHTFIQATRALPKSLCLEMDETDGRLRVSKRITAGSAIEVASLKKQSLFF